MRHHGSIRQRDGQEGLRALARLPSGRAQADPPRSPRLPIGHRRHQEEAEPGRLPVQPALRGVRGGPRPALRAGGARVREAPRRRSGDLRAAPGPPARDPRQARASRHRGEPARAERRRDAQARSKARRRDLRRLARRLAPLPARPPGGHLPRAGRDGPDLARAPGRRRLPHDRRRLRWLHLDAGEGGSGRRLHSRRGRRVSRGDRARSRPPGLRPRRRTLRSRSAGGGQGVAARRPHRSGGRSAPRRGLPRAQSIRRRTLPRRPGADRLRQPDQGLEQAHDRAPPGPRHAHARHRRPCGRPATARGGRAPQRQGRGGGAQRRHGHALRRRREGHGRRVRRRELPGAQGARREERLGPLRSQDPARADEQLRHPRRHPGARRGGRRLRARPGSESSRSSSRSPSA